MGDVMTVTADPTSQTEMVSAEPAQLLFPNLSDEKLAILMPFGATEPTAVGEVLYTAGDPGYDLLVELEGEVAAFDTHHGRRRAIGVLRARDFRGELAAARGQLGAAARAREARTPAGRTSRAHRRRPARSGLRSGAGKER
jgi:hypothetical protein